MEDGGVWSGRGQWVLRVTLAMVKDVNGENENENELVDDVVE